VYCSLLVDGGLRPRPGGLSLRRLELPPQLLALALQPLSLPREGCRTLLLRVLLADRLLYDGGGHRLRDAKPLQQLGAPARHVLPGLCGFPADGCEIGLGAASSRSVV
jgi:hypothetical protein